MLRWTCRAASPLCRTALLLCLAARLAFAQDVSVTRTPIDTDMSVRLTNLTTQVNYERSGDSYFIVPAGRYSVQLLRQGQVAYQEVEFISPDAPQTRTVNPKRMEIVAGLPEGAPQFDSSLCAALQSAARIAVGNYGLHDSDVQRRIAVARSVGDLTNCSTNENVDATAQIVAGSYGVTPFGMLGLSVEFSPLAPQRRPPNRGNSPSYRNPDTQRLATVGQPASDLTPSLVADLKNGIVDVGIDATGKPLLVCAAIDANTPLFCDANGLADATPAIARLRGLFRFHVDAAPVDRFGTEVNLWTAFIGVEAYRTTQQKLVADVQSMQQNLLQRIAALENGSVTAPARHDPSDDVRYYPTSDLAGLIAGTETEMDEALHDPTLQPLRQHFPRPLAQVSEPSHPATRAAEADRIIAILKSDIAVLGTAAGNLGIDLVFRTTPVETAGAHLTFDGCERCTLVTSQGGQHRFYRGRYYVHASLNGYAAYEGWLDLADDSRNIFECEMERAPRGGSGRSSTCSLRSQ